MLPDYRDDYTVLFIVILTNYFLAKDYEIEFHEIAFKINSYLPENIVGVINIFINYD